MSFFYNFHYIWVCIELYDLFFDSPRCIRQGIRCKCMSSLVWITQRLLAGKRNRRIGIHKHADTFHNDLMVMAVVWFQIARLCRATITQVATVRLFAGVNAYMLAMRWTIGKCFVAKLAYVWLGTGVFALVNSQTAQRGKCLRTSGTYEWFNARMRARVHIECVLVFKAFFALLERTFERSNIKNK